MEVGVEEIMINGVAYVPKGSTEKQAEKLNGMKYVIVRTYSAGVFAGYLASKEGQDVVIKNARRLWYWEGASSLSQLAEEGTSKPSGCKFPCEVSSIHLTQAVEILDVMEKAKKSIASVKVWQS